LVRLSDWLAGCAGRSFLLGRREKKEEVRKNKKEELAR
jgi:hypothetical protein